MITWISQELWKTTCLTYLTIYRCVFNILVMFWESNHSWWGTSDLICICVLYHKVVKLMVKLGWWFNCNFLKMKNPSISVFEPAMKRPHHMYVTYDLVKTSWWIDLSRIMLKWLNLFGIISLEIRSWNLGDTLVAIRSQLGLNISDRHGCINRLTSPERH